MLFQLETFALLKRDKYADVEFNMEILGGEADFLTFSPQICWKDTASFGLSTNNARNCKNNIEKRDKIRLHYEAMLVM
jgi:hypothetical protein